MHLHGHVFKSLCSCEVIVGHRDMLDRNQNSFFTRRCRVQMYLKSARYHHNTPALTNFCTSFMRFLSGRHRQCFVPVSRFLTYLQGFCKIYCFSQWIHCYWFVFRVGIGTKRWTFLRSDPRTQLRSIASSMSSRSMNAVTPTPDGPQMRTSRPHRRFPWWQQNLLWLRVKILVHISFAHIS